jgi:molybdopterin-guanine dinucleotide biosynthesis protein A
MGAAILAGGQASRYGGIPKGRLEIAPGLTIIENELRQLRDAGLSEIVIVANDPQPYLPLGAPIIPDLRTGCGPLGGLEAALTYFGARAEAILCLPCDLPGITAGEIRQLREAFVNSGARVAVCLSAPDRMEPLCAVVHRDLLPAITAALEAGAGGAGRLWRQLGALEVPFADPAPFCNVNTPADLAQWLTSHSGAS